MGGHAYTFECTMTVMDKIDGWEAEAKWVGSRLAACMWICTEAVLCDGQERTLEYLMRRLSSIMESVSWVCDESLEGHEWVSDLTISVQENVILVALNYETEVPCVVQWGLLWFSSPSRLNQRFANNGTRIAKCNEVINMAVATTFTLSFGGFNTPRTCHAEIGSCGFVQIAHGQGVDWLGAGRVACASAF